MDPELEDTGRDLLDLSGAPNASLWDPARLGFEEEARQVHAISSAPPASARPPFEPLSTGQAVPQPLSMRRS